MILRRSQIVAWLGDRVLQPLLEWSDRFFGETIPALRRKGPLPTLSTFIRTVVIIAAILVLVIALQGTVRLAQHLSWSQVALVFAATGATLLRVVTALAISVLWTVPVGVLIGMNRKWAAALTPVTQIAASVPATALFPGIVALLIHLQGGLSSAAVLLMVLGTQWYVLFNVIAGASAIPEDLREATKMFRLSRVKVWTTLILPAIYPYLITGLITAAGGAWNASIVAEYVSFQSHVYTTFGIGSLIAQASTHGRFPLLLLSTSSLAVVVVVINRLIWRPLYNRAAERYTLSS